MTHAAAAGSVGRTTAAELGLGKYHGIGNDFLVAFDPSVEPGAALARQLCDRHRGIGADGLVVGRRLAGEGAAVLSFRLFNADGSEAEMSGNGLRCLAHAALDAGAVCAGSVFGVRTPAGQRQVRIHRRGPEEAWGQVEMGVAEVRGGPDRCNVGDRQLRVGVGNPHLVVAGPDPAGVDVAALGPVLERSDPGGINVEFVSLGPGPDELTMRVWERGVGETLACGTGSCAAAVAFHHWGRVGRTVTVHQPGGAAAVQIGEGMSVSLAGPSRRIADCRVRVDRIAP
jgi:diaminopimelate epimerase